MSRVAYDYDAQTWRTEPGAVAALRHAQLEEELALILSPRGSEYLRFVGSPSSVDQAAAYVRASLAELEVAEPLSARAMRG